MKMNVAKLICCIWVGLVVLPADGRTQDAKLPSLSGHWALLRTTNILDKVPVIGDVATKMRTLSIMKLRQKGRRITASEKVCGVKMKSDTELVSLRVKPGLAKGLSGTRRRLKLVGQGQGLRIEQSKQLFTWGVKLSKPATEPLPTTGNDPRIKDVDKDGKPGLTIVIKGIINGEMHVVQRDWSKWSGSLVNANRIEGLVDWSFERVIVGRSTPILPKTHNARVDPEPKNNRIVLVRLPSKTRCRDLKKSFKQYFGKAQQKDESAELAPARPSK